MPSNLNNDKIVEKFEELIAKGIKSRTVNDDFVSAENDFREALLLAEQLNDLTRQAVALNELCACIEDTAGHEALFERAHNTAKNAYDNGVIYCKSAYQLARMNLQQGKTDAAGELIDFLLPALEKISESQRDELSLLFSCYSMRMQIYRMQGDPLMAELCQSKCVEISLRLPLDEGV